MVRCTYTSTSNPQTLNPHPKSSIIHSPHQKPTKKFKTQTSSLGQGIDIHFNPPLYARRYKIHKIKIPLLPNISIYLHKHTNTQTYKITPKELPPFPTQSYPLHIYLSHIRRHTRIHKYPNQIILYNLLWIQSSSIADFLYDNIITFDLIQHLSIYLTIYPSIYRSIYPSNYLANYTIINISILPSPFPQKENEEQTKIN